LKKLFLICFLYFQLPVSFSQKKYFQQQVNYKIDVSLNDMEKVLNGFEVIDYTNNSPDTLSYIWFHLWPNAFKNDHTAFSNQLLQSGRTDFYFSNDNKRGYINRLDFKVNGITAVLEDHPLYIDVAKLILPAPLPPGQTIKITTPFHEKIPFNFSRGGHVGNTYQITQWYPKPAVYDNRGWHPMPYLNQGEFYSEFGNFDVTITLPKDYIVAATGKLKNEDELKWLKEKAEGGIRDQVSGIRNKKPGDNNGKSAMGHQQAEKKKQNKTKKKYQPTYEKKKIILKNPIANASTEKTKTLTYTQNNVHDFAWFANKNFIVRQDTLQLASGRIIDAWSFFTPSGLPVWKNSIQLIKDAIKTRSKWLGEYPYNTVTAVEAKMGFSGGMEYPTITSISPMPDEKSLDMTIEHEVGHNWVYGILASNEREFPWMDEGMNTYFDNRYKKLKYPENSEKKNKDFIASKFPDDNADIIYRNQIATKRDQPIETPSQDFSEINYSVIAYYKTGLWMKKLENYAGRNVFDSCLHEYYNRWKFKHPYPEDFKKVVEEVSKKNVDTIFSLLSKKGSLDVPKKKKTKVSAFFNFNNTGTYNYLFLSPAFGYNYYDNIMIGGLAHNYTFPEKKFQFFVAPLYATGSKTFTGIARVGYHIMSYGAIRKTEISLSGEKFNMDEFTDSTGKKNYMGFSKIVPSIKLIFRNKNATSSVKKWIQWKTYFINETQLSYNIDTNTHESSISFPKTKRYLNQLTLAIENDRALYPYSANIVAEQGKEFVRLAFEGKYFFNYPKDGGLNARLFAGKFMYLGAEDFFGTDRYHLDMTGPNGYEDYTYSNYFIGRNEFQKLPSQQIMIRDGGFKVRTDLLNSKIGKTDNWLAAVNLNTDFPKEINPLQVLPVDIPLKVFLDIGTYADVWKNNAPTGKFIYDAGLQVSLFKNIVNIYVPLLYSKVYADYFKSTIPKDKRFWQNISFSIDIQNFRFNKFFNLPEL
jgi:hypothetical protein